LGRYFAAIEKKIADTAAILNVLVKSAIDDRTQQAEKFEQIALARAVAADEDIQIAQREIFQRPDGLKAPDGQAVK
jgi:hypothetical protein